MIDLCIMILGMVMIIICIDVIFKALEKPKNYCSMCKCNKNSEFLYSVINNCDELFKLCDKCKRTHDVLNRDMGKITDEFYKGQINNRFSEIVLIK